MIDLHLHSIASDGLDSPSKIIDIALSLNLRAIALTDHDTIDGLQEFLSYGEDKQIIVLPGIEISIKHELAREIKDVHIIGLNFDYQSPNLIHTIKKQKEGRIEQKREICKILKEEHGYIISFKEVQAIAGSESIGRSHIVEILLKNNEKRIIQEGLSKNQLFKLIGVGGAVYVERGFELTLEESTAVINAAGGIPILAHPGIYNVSNRKKFIEMCVNSGGIRGIEIEYVYMKNRPFYSDPKKARSAQSQLPAFYRNIAENLNLIKSGGSDYHGGKKNIKIGEANVPDEYLKKIL